MDGAIETYEQAIEFLYARINYERLSGDLLAVDDFKLDRMAHLLDRLGNPHADIPVVHVAGSKGKGSTAAMIAAGFTAAKCRTALFTSPHIEFFEERMTVDGIRPTHEAMIGLVNEMAEVVREIQHEPGRVSPTYFELATAIAWRYFLGCQVDLAVLEVGLGGRLDATNICHPAVSVITTISRDHTRLLGSDLSSIAREKAGIIKPAIPVVCGVTDGEALATILSICNDLETDAWRLGHEIRFRHNRDRHTVCVETPRRHWPEVTVPLPGRHQASNTALAMAAIDRMQQPVNDISADAVVKGIAEVRWPVRIEVMSQSPTVVLDAAHNWASIQALLETLDEGFPARRRVLVFATSRDKDADGLLRRLLPRFDTIVLTQFLDNPRAVPAEDLHRRVREVFGVPVHTTPDPSTAWRLARRLAGPEDLICVTGSFFIAAEIRELIIDAPQSLPAGTF